MPRLGVLLLAAALAVLMMLLASGVAFADDCSSPADCEQTAGYNAVLAITGGITALFAALFGPLLSGLGGGVAPPIPPGLIPTQLPPTGPLLRDEFGEPLDPWSPDYEPGDDGYPGKPGDVWYDGKWMDPGSAQREINQQLAWDRFLDQQVEEAKLDVEQWRKRVEEGGDDWFQEELDKLMQDVQESKEIANREEAAYTTLEKMRKYAELHGDEEFLEKLEANAWNPDGSPNLDYIDKARGLLKNRIYRDVTAPDGSEPGWVTEFVTNTVDDAVHNPVIRIGMGILSGGSSEVAYQSLAAYEAMQRAAEEALEKGEEFSGFDAFKIGLITLGEENLPVNTINTLNDPNATFGDVMLSLGFDILATADVIETASNIKGGFDVRAPWTKVDAPPGTKIDPTTQLGISEFDKNGLEGVSSKHNVNIDVRASNPDSAKWLNEGYPPKPEAIKSKTISDADTLLGANAADKGKVGYFDPQLPEGVKLEDLPEDVQKRYHQRKQEFIDQKPKMDKMIADGKVEVDDNGVVINTGLNTNPDMAGKAFTGDIDLKNITDADTGLPVSPKKAAEVAADAAPYGVEHPDLDHWDPKTNVDQGIKDNIQNKHAPTELGGGGEPLGSVGPGGEWTENFHQPGGPQGPQGPAFSFQEGPSARGGGWGAREFALGSGPEGQPPPTEPGPEGQTPQTEQGPDGQAPQSGPESEGPTRQS